MAAIQSDLTILRNASDTLSVSVGNLTAQGLQAYSDVRFTAKRDVGDADTLAIISKQLGSGITITTDGDATTAGVLSIAIAPADTVGLPSGYTVALVYDVRLYDATGADYPVAYGTLTVTPTATQATS